MNDSAAGRPPRAGPPDDRPRSRRMLGFYIAMGAALALFVGGWFAWTPLRIGYWEGKVRRTDPSPYVKTGPHGSCFVQPCDRAARALAELGPAALPAVSRLLRDENSQTQAAVVRALGDTKSTWALPLLIELMEKPTAEYGVILACVYAVSNLTGYRVPTHYSGTSQSFTDNDNAQHCRRSLLDWWGREGRAKYGRGAE